MLTGNAMAAPPFALCLVVDDDDDIRLSARLALAPLFAEVATTATPAEAVAMLATRRPDAILLDANFARGATDGAEGFRWLAAILAADPAAAVVMITAHSSVRVAVDAMKHGATDFVSKPWNNDRLLATVRNAARLGASRRTEGQPARGPAGTSPLLGGSAAMARVQSLIEKAAPTDANVLILGENGTGKELVARELHRLSHRAGAELVTVDLGAVAETLFDSELFGHVKGAFTDARTDRVGRIQAADGGTLFLDEVGNLPLHLQPRLLTVLEQRRVVPVGANRPVPVDVRVVAATNANLADEHRFRQDLLFRLNTVEIELPPLRDRREDIPLLLETFLADHARRYAKPARALPDGVLAALVAHDWPGNVRALRHAAERAVILAEGASYTLADFPLPRGAGPAAEAAVTNVTDFNLDRAERQLIEAALRRHAFNISTAAADLGLSRGALYRRMEKHGL